MMDSTIVRSTLLVLLSSVGLCYGADIILDDLIHATTGESVKFTTSVKPTDGPFLAMVWSFNTTTNVITSTTADVVGNDYENRVELDKTTGSLLLKNVTEKDSGKYELIMIPYGAVQIHGSVNLEVTTKVSRPTIDCPTGNVIEGQSSLNLTCNTDGAGLKRVWMKDGQPLVPGGRFSFYDGDRVLSISPVHRTDTGVFLCNVSNHMSFDTATCTLKVFYGPDAPTIVQEPNGAELEDSVTLFCSANSRPPAKYVWTFKNMKLYGPVHYINEMQMYHLGRYTCTARNDITGQEMSAFHTLRDSSTLISGSLSILVCTVLNLVGLMLL